MYEEEVELPSDIVGIGYVAVKSDDKWQYELAHELQKCGFNILLDNLLK
jgi:predicted nucleotide-binding protein